MRYVRRRAAFFGFTLWMAMTLNFVIPRLMPGNPAEAMMAQYKGHVNPQALQALEIAFGVNEHVNPLVAYLEYLRNSFTGHFGVSLTFFPDPVITVVAAALPWTVILVGMTTVLSFFLGTLIGLLSGWRRKGRFDSILVPVSVMISGLPFFWVGLVLIMIFALTLKLFPVSGGYAAGLQPGWSWPFVQSALYHSVLPAITIIVVSIGGWVLTMRNNVITVLAEDYVRMARAKGLGSWTIVWRYVGRNAVLPNLTGFAMSLGFVVSGAILVEYVFDYPGVGWMLLQAVQNEDYALMQALFLLITAAVLLAILAADIVTALIDPRTR
jgi:peptide/nickel transport system permease protein